MKKLEIRWRTINQPPNEDGYVLLAITHHNIPAVVMGFCKIHKTQRGKQAEFKEDVYHGNGVIVTHWAELPPHPYEAKEESNVSKAS